MDHWTKEKQPQKKKPKTPFHTLVLMTGVSNVAKSTQGPPHSGCSAGTKCSRINEDSCEPVAPWLEYPDVLLTRASALSPPSYLGLPTKEAHCKPQLYARQQGDRHPPGWASRKVNCLTWLWSGLRFPLMTTLINVSACTPGSFKTHETQHPSSWNGPDPSALTLHS